MADGVEIITILLEKIVTAAEREQASCLCTHRGSGLEVSERKAAYRRVVCADPFHV